MCSGVQGKLTEERIPSNITVLFRYKSYLPPQALPADVAMAGVLCTVGTNAG